MIYKPVEQTHYSVEVLTDKEYTGCNQKTGIA